MKKRQLVAMALVSAMSVSTAASFVPAKTYAAEKEVKLAETFDKLAKKFAKFPTLEVELKKFDTEEKLVKFNLTDAEFEQLKSIANELKVLEGKELGSLKLAKPIIDAYEELLTEKESGKIALAYDVNNHETLILYRKAELKKIKEEKTDKVVVAENELKKAQDEFETALASKDYSKISEKSNAVEKAQKSLEDARKAEIEALDELLTKISSTESFNAIKGAVDATISKVYASIARLISEHNLAVSKKAYLDAKEVINKYSDAKGLKNAQDKANKEYAKYVESVVAKVNRQLTKNEKIEAAHINKLVMDANLKAEEKLDAKTKILIKNVLSDAELKEYAEKMKANAELNTFKVLSETELKELAKKYDEDRKSVEVAKKSEMASEKLAKEVVANLEFVNYAKDSGINYDSYKNHLDARDVVLNKVNKVEKAFKEASEKLKAAEKALDLAKEALAKDKDSLIKQEDVKTAENDLKARKEAFEKVEKKLATVKADLERLENLSKDLHKKFREYSEALIKGAGNYELKLIKENLKLMVESYNEFAGEYSLPEIKIDRAEVVATTGTWVKVDGVWYYKDAKNMDVYKNAWAKIDGVWYRFDEAGKMLANQWFKEDGKWYWLEASGSMASSEWVYVKGSWFWAHSSGRIAENEWVWVKGQWYYAKSGGYLAMNTSLRIDGTVYKFAKSGAWVK